MAVWMLTPATTSVVGDRNAVSPRNATGTHRSRTVVRRTRAASPQVKLSPDQAAYEPTAQSNIDRTSSPYRGATIGSLSHDWTSSISAYHPRRPLQGSSLLLLVHARSRVLHQSRQRGGCVVLHVRRRDGLRLIGQARPPGDRGPQDDGRPVREPVARRQDVGHDRPRPGDVAAGRPVVEVPGRRLLDALHGAALVEIADRHLRVLARDRGARQVHRHLFRSLAPLASASRLTHWIASPPPPRPV